MKSVLYTVLSLLLFSIVYPQDVLQNYDPKNILTSDQCYEVIKSTWDGLKKLAEDSEIQNMQKSEFETTAEFNNRVRKDKDQFINKVDAFAAENKFSQKEFSVWFKATLVKYDADKQVYNVTSPTQIFVQPAKDDIMVECPSNKYVVVSEKNEKGYRSAFFHLNTEPDFSWYVNKVTAQAAKAKEYQIYFKLSFTFNVSVNEAKNQIVLHITPHKLSLMDQAENFTYWSEEIY
jgi:hypothetical protein